MTKENVSWPPSSLGFWSHTGLGRDSEWAADANIFLSREEDDTQVYSVRVAFFELLSVRRGRRCSSSAHEMILPQSLLASSSVQTASSLHASIQRIVIEANRTRDRGVEDW
jgi:importin-9